ncbi:MAG: hypothetical protein NVS3B5_04410 [Sphingomicrobium sp.]
MMAQVALQAPKSAYQANYLPIARRSTAVAKIPVATPLLKQSTAVHPAAIWISIGSFAWFVIAAWIGFAADREAAVSIFMVGFINVMLIGLLAGGGWYSRNMTPDRSTTRSFGAFVRGPVDTATGSITGREALFQIAALPVILSIGGTIIIALAVWCGVVG